MEQDGCQNIQIAEWYFIIISWIRIKVLSGSISLVYYISYFVFPFSIILEHSNVYLARALVIATSSCDNRKINFAKLSMFSKFDTALFTIWYKICLWLLNLRQAVRKCISSPSTPHSSHNLSCLARGWRCLVPFSIINWWSDTLSFTRAVKCLWFATKSKHFSNFGCNLKILNVSAFGDSFSLVLHFSSNNLLIFFLRLIIDSAITFGIAYGGAYWVASLCNEFSIVILSSDFLFSYKYACFTRDILSLLVRYFK